MSELLDENTAPRIWDETNRQLAAPEFTAQAILRKFGVRAICTTDDPADSLQYHERLVKSAFEIRVFPAFRPDQALRVHDPNTFAQWTERLGRCADLEIRTLADLLAALRKRHQDFHQVGCRLSDHGLDTCPGEFGSDSEAEAIFKKAMTGDQISADESLRWTGYMMLFFACLDAEKGWTKLLLLGAFRSAISRAARPPAESDPLQLEPCR